MLVLPYPWLLDLLGFVSSVRGTKGVTLGWVRDPAPRSLRNQHLFSLSIKYRVMGVARVPVLKYANTSAMISNTCLILYYSLCPVSSSCNSWRLTFDQQLVLSWHWTKIKLGVGLKWRNNSGEDIKKRDLSSQSTELDVMTLRCCASVGTRAPHVPSCSRKAGPARAREATHSLVLFWDGSWNESLSVEKN